MSFYGGNQNGGQPGNNQQQQIARQQPNPGLQNVQQVLTPQLFNINVNPGQLHNFFNEQNSLQLNAAAAGAAANQSILLQSQQTQSFPVNLINEQLGVGVGQLISSATVSQGQMQGLPISMSSALTFPQSIQVHAQTPPPQQNQGQNQQQKQRVFTGTVTKVHDNFGFIDEEVFFQMGVVKGPILPKEGDRVLVEADFNSNMPFKWNATRVQIVNIGGGMNSLNNMNTSQQQHLQQFNPSVGMQKQSSAPPPPVLTSQAPNARPHGAQPVTIVSNPHSVYSGGNNPRGRPIGAPVPPPVGVGTPMVAPQRDPKRPMAHMPMVPDPPGFMGNAPVSGLMSADRDLDRERGRDRSRERTRARSRDRSRDHVRERSRDRGRPRSRDRSRERDRANDRSRERDKATRARSRSRDRAARDRSRSRDRSNRASSRDRNFRERSADRSLSTRNAPRTRETDRNVRERSSDRRDKSKRERSPEKQHERSRDHGRDRDTAKDKDSKNSTSPLNNKSNKDDARKDGKSKEKEKQATVEKTKSTRDRSPSSAQSASQSLERSKRSKSRESVKTEKGHGPTESERSRSNSPSRRKASRPAPRYAVEIPKFSLDTKDVGVKEVQRRYPNLYVPSDFFLAKCTWMDTFPLDSPFELGHPCPVQIMRKGVQRIEIPNPEEVENWLQEVPDILEPADASYIFKSKVMIPSMSSLETFYRKSCGVADNAADVPDSPQHIDRLISFIVGMKTSKHEVMALGGPWSPSLDGANPQSDPRTLINTAIRSVRALTGINLSRCKHWYRFMELYYKRSNCLETVVFYLPDVWSCLPGTKEWSKLKSVYKYALCGEKNDVADKNILKAEKETIISSNGKQAEMSAVVNGTVGNETSLPVAGAESAAEHGDIVDKTDLSGSILQEEDVMNNSGLLVIDEAASPAREDGGLDDVKAENVGQTSTSSDHLGTDSSGKMETEDNRRAEPDTVDLKSCQDIKSKTANEDTEIQSVPIEEKSELSIVSVTSLNGGNAAVVPTHFSLLTPKSMNVAQLKEELVRRNLSAKGLKSQLTTRLVKALKDEESRDKEIEEAKTRGLELNLTSTSEQEDVPTKCEGQTETAEESIEAAQGLEEHDIRIVNPSQILETQDDEMSIEDGELKEQIMEDSSGQESTEYEIILSKFPNETFPIIKLGMNDDEIKMWERRYALPKNPRLLIYPSSVAKSGNFDCLSMTLGLLRDYRIIDKKEDNFEVSLFSEFFHEMLQRDFAFRIYREIMTESVKPSSDDSSSIKDGDIKDDKSEKEVAEPATKKRKLSSNSVANSGSQTQLKKTTDPFLLLSFVFFDVTRCGYITETDLEDLCNCIGLGLTRAQIRKVVQKVVHKGTLYYRKWTDRLEKIKDTCVEDIHVLAQGNKGYFPVFIHQENGRLPISKSGTSAEGDETTEAIIAVVDGRDIDVKKLLDQLDKCEKDLAVAESSLNVMKNSLNEAKSQVTDLKKSNESLKEELTKIKEALKKSENSEKSAKENVEVFKRSTERFLERIKDLVKFPSSTGKDKSDTVAKDTGKIKDKSNVELKEKSKSSNESDNNQTTSKDSASASTDEHLA